MMLCNKTYCRAGRVILLLFVSLLSPTIAGVVVVDDDASSGDNEHRELIVGGALAAPLAYPSYGAVPGCGSVLIHPQIALTAAHCGGNFLNRNLNIGGNRASFVDAQEKIRVVQEFPHPRYNPNSGSEEFDAMLLLLERPSQQPLAAYDGGSSMTTNAPTSAVVQDGDYVSVIGFGAIGFGSGDISDLREVKLQVVDFETCNMQYNGGIVQESMICAAGNGKDTCQGDSGGPLFDANNVVIGIVSFGGIGCGDPNFSGGYTRVSAVSDFIRVGICQLATMEKPTNCDSITQFPTMIPTAAPATSNGQETATNDICANALQVTIDGMTISGTTAGSTSDGLTDCFVNIDGSTPGVWYTLEATDDRFLVASATDDKIVSIYKGSCGMLECIDYGFDLAVFQPSPLTWLSERGVVYHIFIHDNDLTGNATPGAFQLTLGSADIQTATDTPSISPRVTENGSCDKALPIEAGDRLFGSTIGFTVDDRAPKCDSDGSNNNLVSPGAWFIMEGSGVELRTFTCRGSSFSVFDTLITVYEGTSCNDLKCVGFDNNACGLQSIFAWGGEVGIQYYVVVSGGSGATVATGEYQLDTLLGQAFTDAPTRAPAVNAINDVCEVAIPLADLAQTISGSTAGATFDQAPLCSTGNTGPGVWYSMIGDGGMVTIDTCGDGAATFDTKITVFTGVSCSDLTCGVGNDDACGTSSRVSFQSIEGETYYILVHGFGQDKGDFDLTVSTSKEDETTTAPSLETNTTNSFAVCFPGDALVELRDGRSIKMNSLKIGDVVRDGEDTFSTIFSFGHLERDTWASYLQISTQDSNAITLSSDHLIFTSIKGTVPASALTIGDEIILCNRTKHISSVSNIELVNLKGVYAPFTKSGKIMVDGFLSSTYAALNGQSSVLLGGMVQFDTHWLSHMFLAPHRLCYFHFGIIHDETYTQEGHSKWIADILVWARWIVADNNAVIQMITFIPAFLIVVACALLEKCLSFSSGVGSMTYIVPYVVLAYGAVTFIYRNDKV